MQWPWTLGDVLWPVEHALSPLAVSFSTATLLVACCILFGSHRVLRWPLLFVSVVHVAVELTVVAILVAAMGFWDSLMERLSPTPATSRLLNRMETAKNWAEYHAAARQLDNESVDCAEWRSKSEDNMYNATAVRLTLQRLRSARADGDIDALLDILGTCVRKSYCGIDHEALYSRCHSGTKKLVEMYVDEVVASLAEVQSRVGRGDEALDARVNSMLYRSQRVFGRTCLALSGGGGLANFSWGVTRALYDRGLLPSLVCGTSAGAVIAATLCTHTDAELGELLTAETLCGLLTSFEEDRTSVLRRMVRTGHMYNEEHWGPKIRALCNHAAYPDLTFAEAFKLSGRELCVTVTARRRHEPPLVLSRLSAPDVTVASAVLATVAMPFLIPAQQLVRKCADGELRPWAAGGPVSPPRRRRHSDDADADGEASRASCDRAFDAEGDNGGTEWRDGSIVHDTPREQLAQHFGASFVVASQCNPHVVPLFIALRPTAGRPAVSRLQRGRGEWRGGFALSALLVLLLSDAKKWLTVLRELEIMPLVLDTDWSSLFLQDFTGDVTVIPPLRFADYMNVLADPTLEVMERYLRVGQRECWRKMPMLATRLRIAHALREVQAALAAAGSSGSLAESFELVQEHSRAVDAVAPALASGHASTAPTSFRRSDSMLVF